MLFTSKSFPESPYGSRLRIPLNTARLCAVAIARLGLLINTLLFACLYSVLYSMLLIPTHFKRSLSPNLSIPHASRANALSKAHTGGFERPEWSWVEKFTVINNIHWTQQYIGWRRHANTVVRSQTERSFYARYILVTVVSSQRIYDVASKCSFELLHTVRWRQHS